VIDDHRALSDRYTAAVAAFIGYVGTLEEWEQPRGDNFCGDKKRPSGWFIKLCQMLERTIKRLDVER
jgi:hypothetical protein